jgi:hypothetical protein
MHMKSALLIGLLSIKGKIPSIAILHIVAIEQRTLLYSLHQQQLTTANYKVNFKVQIFKEQTLLYFVSYD